MFIAGVGSCGCTAIVGRPFGWASKSSLLRSLCPQWVESGHWAMILFSDNARASVGRSQMGNESNGLRTVVMIAGLCLVSTAIYLRPKLLISLGYADAGTPRTVFIVASAIAMILVSLIAIFVDRLASDTREQPK
jgi:hypothetical protein